MELVWGQKRERQNGAEEIGRGERTPGPGTYKKDRNRQGKKSDGCRGLAVGAGKNVSTHTRSVSYYTR